MLACCCALVAGCGSLAVAELPAPEGPPARAVTGDGRVVLVLDPLARTLTELDRRTGAVRDRVPVGAGPAGLAADDKVYAYVIDAALGALLVIRREPLAVVRRVALPGRPSAIAIDTRRRRLFVAYADRGGIGEFRATARPLFVRSLPAIAGARRLVVDSVTGRVRAGR